jgi:hypothetical protein
VQGVVHEIGHLATASHAQKGLSAPHASYCAECLALAQAGAAPVNAPPAGTLPIGVHAPLVAAVSTPPTDTSALGYRSRAPPSSSI